MTEFRKRDFTDARFKHVDFEGSAFTKVRLNRATMRSVEISGALQNVVVNGVDIAPLVEAELNRRNPDRAIGSALGRGPRGGKASRGTATRNRRSTRCSPYEEIGRRWSAMR